MPIHLPDSLAPYAKAVAAVVAALAVVVAAVADLEITPEEIGSIVAAVGGAVAVFQVKNA